MPNKWKGSIGGLMIAMMLWSGCTVDRTFPVGMEGASWRNSVYLAHEWVDVPPDPVAIGAMVETFGRTGVHTVYVHVGPLEADGSIPVERYVYAQAFAGALKEAAPTLEVHAWIGQREVRGGGILDVRKEAVRERIVETAEEFVALGYDGIHLNIEPMIVEDESKVFLLIALKEALGKVPLSIAVTPVEPVTGVHNLSKLWRTGRGMFLREGEFRMLAEHVDHVMVMTYDTGLQEPFYYTTFVAMATQRMLRAAEGVTDVYMGVPTYNDVRPNFNDQVENMETALLGVKSGVRNYGAAPHFQGVGIYAHWTTTEADWETLRRILSLP